jgi:hypothetical protein
MRDIQVSGALVCNIAAASLSTGRRNFFGYN